MLTGFGKTKRSVTWVSRLHQQCTLSLQQKEDKPNTETFWKCMDIFQRFNFSSYCYTDIIIWIKKKKTVFKTNAKLTSGLRLLDTTVGYISIFNLTITVNEYSWLDNTYTHTATYFTVKHHSALFLLPTSSRWAFSKWWYLCCLSLHHHHHYCSSSCQMFLQQNDYSSLIL